MSPSAGAYHYTLSGVFTHPGPTADLHRTVKTPPKRGHITARLTPVGLTERRDLRTFDRFAVKIKWLNGQIIKKPALLAPFVGGSLK